MKNNQTELEYYLAIYYGDLFQSYFVLEDTVSEDGIFLYDPSGVDRADAWQHYENHLKSRFPKKYIDILLGESKLYKISI